MFAVAVVAAAVEDYGGNAGPGDEVEHVLIPGGEMSVVQFHLAEAVVLMRVSPGDPEDDVRREGMHGRRQAAFQRLEVGVAGDVPREFDVQRARRLDGGVVLADVNRIGEDPRVRGEDAVGAVALMRVGVHDEGPQAGSGEVQVTDGDGDVIEHAVALAMVREGMMRPAG